MSAFLNIPLLQRIRTSFRRKTRFEDNKQRQLHRSKTLPVIHSPYQCTDEDELPGCQHMVQGAMDNTQRWSNRSPDSS
ncbi:Hypothetical predicted protein, partial [Mytilus galloprovincialis]